MTSHIKKVMKMLNVNFSDYDGFITERIGPHLAIEFLRGEFEGGFLLESCWNGNDRNNIFESYGVFNGCENIANQIYDEIVGSKVVDGTIINVIPKIHTFFKQAVVEFKDSVPNARYSSHESVFSKKDGKFDKIHIYINPSEYNGTFGLVSVLMHELQHAYEDYRLRLRGYSLSQRNKDYGVYEISQLERGYDVLAQYLSSIFYFLHKVEVNSYVTSLYGELKQSKTKFETVSDVVDFIRNTQSVKNYYAVFKMIGELMKVRKPEYQYQCVLYANHFLKKKVSDFEHLIKWIERKKSWVNDKLDRMIVKIAYEYFHDKMLTVDTKPPLKVSDLLKIKLD